MRFSSLFLQLAPARPQADGTGETRVETRAPEATPPQLPELPEDLDARVRLVGEWQLGEAAS